MKKRSVLIFSLVLCMVCNLLGVGFTQAWFVSGGSVGSGDYSAAKVMYLPDMEPDPAQKSVYGSLMDASTQEREVFIVPGDQIIRPFSETQEGRLSLENFSTVDTNVRMTIDCTFLNEDGTEGAMAGFSWNKIDDNTYQYGVTTNIEGANVHMGLLEFKLAATTMADTLLPDGTSPSVVTTPYRWDYSPQPAPAEGSDQISFANSWELKLDGNATIPRVAADTRQYYNAVTSISVVGAHPQEPYQDAFNQFFSDNYAGHQIRITISYYAKQLMGMEWEMFTQTVFNANMPIA